MAETIRTPVFSRYDVREKIGSGSMGAVYKALDRRLDRWVALKVLPPGLREHGESVERFKREARVLARLKHPGVASVYDANVESDFPYVVMEFVEGENLEEGLRRHGPMPVEEVVRLGVEMAEALAHIHSHRVVHRDVKTANIIIGPEGRAVLADFGIAFVASLPRLSQGTLGTPEYMSPEQADGRPVDGRSDLYSVGVVLYECLAGEVPFQREGESLSGLTDLLQRILACPPPSLRALRPDVPAWLAGVIERCLAKDPEERFTRAADLAAALQQTRVADAEPVSAPVHPDAPAPPIPTRLLLSHAEPVEAVRFGPDGRHLASACKDRVIRIWEVKTGRLVHLLKGPSAVSISYRPGGVFLAAGCVDGAVRIWDVEAELLKQTILAHTGYVLAVAYSRDGDLLASGAMDGAVHIWQARTGRLLRTLGQHTGYVLSVSFSPDGAKLASGAADGAVRIWEVKTGRLLHRLKGHAGYVPSVSFSPDGRRLASGGVDGAVRIWEVETGRLLHRQKGHADWVMSVAFSPDGRHLASAGRDHTVRLWEAGSGRPLDRLKGHTGAVMSVSFSPDGLKLASGSSDHTARLWHLDPRAIRRRSRVKRLLAAALVTALLALGIWVERGPLRDLNVASFFSPPPETQTVEAPSTMPARRESGTRSRLPAARPSLAAGETGDSGAGEDRTLRQAEEPAMPVGLPERLRSALYDPSGIILNRGGFTLVTSIETDRVQAQRASAHLREHHFRVGVLGVYFQGRVSYRIGVGQFASHADAAHARRHMAGNVLPYNTWVMHIRPEAAF